MRGVFWMHVPHKAHCGTMIGKQGGDVGTQYRSGVYTTDAQQAAAAEAAIERLNDKLGVRARAASCSCTSSDDPTRVHDAGSTATVRR